nr:hypothetical protein [Tanacetum cinerariifolium]
MPGPYNTYFVTTLISVFKLTPVSVFKVLYSLDYLPQFKIKIFHIRLLQTRLLQECQFPHWMLAPPQNAYYSS